MFFPKFVTVTKNTPFLSIFAPLNDVRAYCQDLTLYYYMYLGPTKTSLINM